MKFIHTTVHNLPQTRSEEPRTQSNIESTHLRKYSTLSSS